MQLWPVESQRDQTYPNDVGPFDHVPVVALRILPTRTEPEIAGGFVLSGAEVAVAGAAVGAAAAAIFIDGYPIPLVWRRERSRRVSIDNVGGQSDT